MDIIIKIPDDKLAEFRAGYLKVIPSENGQTDLQNVRSFLKQKLIDIYITGKTLIARETTTPEYDKDIIEE